ncbi:MAG: Mitochondrial-processing peptidase subunit alpha [Bathelium mastoideum]|nr:MAG: Mitochondrial-processing peptidase subunit alpha [Bathelium mastoideum]
MGSVETESDCAGARDTPLLPPPAGSQPLVELSEVVEGRRFKARDCVRVVGTPSVSARLYGCEELLLEDGWLVERDNCGRVDAPDEALLWSLPERVGVVGEAGEVDVDMVGGDGAGAVNILEGGRAGSRITGISVACRHRSAFSGAEGGELVISEHCLPNCESSPPHGPDGWSALGATSGAEPGLGGASRIFSSSPSRPDMLPTTRAIAKRSAPQRVFRRVQYPPRHYASIAGTAQQDPVDLDRITTLSNGIRVATEALPGHFSGIGVYVDAGSRYENHALRGVSHIIDRLAFQSTKQRTVDEMAESMETLGGNIQCASSRESLMYQSATFNSAVPSAVALLAETIRDPLITEEEVQMQLETAEYEIGEIWSKPELILPELVHMAAYKDNTLGNPLLCPKDRLSQIDKSVVDAYRETFYQPERIVVAFAGVNHAEAVKLTEKHFGDMARTKGPVISGVGTETTIQDANSNGSSSQTPYSPSSTPVQEPSRLLSKIPFLKNLSTSTKSAASVLSTTASTLDQPSPLDLHAASHYTGGFLSLPPIPIPTNPALPRLSHIHVAFEALPISSDDIYALATLQTLLGGGGSFSAGGPGKGMYSRLYTRVLNQHGWVENCVAFNHSYTDSGLFGISASCSPGQARAMVETICAELAALTHETGHSALRDGEVQRAKNQLRSSLLMNLESRMVELEDLGRQVQVHGRKVGVKEMCRRIEEVTVRDLRRVAKDVLKGGINNKGQGSGAPTVVLQEGEEEGCTLKPMKWDDIQERISKWGLGRR